MDIFKNHIQIIKEKNYQFENPDNFQKNFDSPKNEKKILITIDDAFSSFYEKAWPFLKKNKIPFILFVSTEPVGKNGYMTWNQIKEVEKEKFAYIGNHSHSHEYLLDLNFQDFKKDINKSISFLENMLNDIVNQKIPMHKLIISKSLRSFYKNPKQIAHKVLADRMGQRDPGNKPGPGDRIPYVYILTSKKKDLQGNKIENPDYIREKKLKIDYGFYIKFVCSFFIY